MKFERGSLKLEFEVEVLSWICKFEVEMVQLWISNLYLKFEVEAGSRSLKFEFEFEFQSMKLKWEIEDWSLSWISLVTLGGQSDSLLQIFCSEKYF